jgi:hypothetical protein
MLALQRFPTAKRFIIIGTYVARVIKPAAGRVQILMAIKSPVEAFGPGKGMYRCAVKR